VQQGECDLNWAATCPLICNLCEPIIFFPVIFSTRVSNELGAGRPQAARLAVRVAVSMVATEGIVAATVMILGRNVWGYCYSKEQEVVRYVGQMLVLIGISHFFDGIQSVLSGLLLPFCPLSVH
jgi:MATE family multidrug resistance protein